MALKYVFVLALIVVPALALADCKTEATKARDAIVTSGPFFYTSRHWGRSPGSAPFDRSERGVIDPDKAQHIEHIQAMGPKRETIWIGKQRWGTDSFGWLPPEETASGHMLTIPFASYTSPTAKCLGTVDIDGHRVIGYELETEFGEQTLIEKLFVDPTTQLTIRFEWVVAPHADKRRYVEANLVSTFRYDPSIRIEPPKVDLAARQVAFHNVFDRAVASSDPKCRQEVLEIIQRGQTEAPFRYKITGGLWEGVSGMHGTVVPPQSIHNIVDGSPQSGGGSEIVKIGDRTWQRQNARMRWIETTLTSVLVGGRTGSRSHPLVLPSYVSGEPGTVGAAKCLGERSTIYGRYRVYEYELYADVRWAGKFLINKRMRVDLTSNLPSLFENFDFDGRIRTTEVIEYDKDIRIDVPQISYSASAPRSAMPPWAKPMISPPPSIEPSSKPQEGGLY